MVEVLELEHKLQEEFLLEIQALNLKNGQVQLLQLLRHHLHKMLMVFQLDKILTIFYQWVIYQVVLCYGMVHHGHQAQL
ncbi:MAG: hypothetical protein CMG85_18915 [Marinobacter sp.]|nr:hypothetical protein [Marinobacter sp.]